MLLATVGVHALGLLVTAAVVALVVYEWAGLGVLRRAWVNLDLVWDGGAPARRRGDARSLRRDEQQYEDRLLSEGA